MSGLESGEVSAAILEMRDLLRLLAEPAIAARDKKLREELRKIVGTSPQKRGAALLMDGTRPQSTIGKEAGIKKGNLSVFVKQLKGAGLITSDPKQPKLSIPIPATFFDQEWD